MFQSILASLFRILSLVFFVLIGSFISAYFAFLYIYQNNANVRMPGLPGVVFSKISTAIGLPAEELSGAKYVKSILYGPVIPAPEFVGITHWYQDNVVRLSDDRGKRIVVLTFGRIDCSYCLNVYTYLNEWKRQYGDLIHVIAIQSPKYDDEKDWSIITKKLEERDVFFDVGFDLNLDTLHAYKKVLPDWEYVPTVFVIDTNGLIRYRHTGEGNFDEARDAIDEVMTLSGHISPPR